MIDLMTQAVELIPKPPFQRAGMDYLPASPFVFLPVFVVFPTPIPT